MCQALCSSNSLNLHGNATFGRILQTMKLKRVEVRWPKSQPKPGFETRCIQHQFASFRDSDFAFWGLSLLPTVIFCNLFLGLGTISNFHNDCSVEDSRFFLVFFFLRDKYSPLAISYPNIIVEANKEKQVFAAGNSAEVEKTRSGPTEAEEIQLTPIGCLFLVISYGNSAKSTSVLGVQDKIENKCFCLADDLPFGNS